MAFLFFVGLVTASLALGYTYTIPEKASFCGEINENRYSIEDIQKTQSIAGTADYVLRSEDSSRE